MSVNRWVTPGHLTAGGQRRNADIVSMHRWQVMLSKDERQEVGMTLVYLGTTTGRGGVGGDAGVLMITRDVV